MTIKTQTIQLEAGEIPGVDDWAGLRYNFSNLKAG
jgi:hypothetical protein